jgi:hypothetical protein
LNPGEGERKRREREENRKMWKGNERQYIWREGMKLQLRF